MESKIKRPISVWIAQIILLLAALPFFLLLPFRIFSLPADVPKYGWLSVIVVLLLPFVFLVPLVFGFIGMAKRKSYGRWLGIICLILMSGFAIFITFRRGSGPVPYAQYSNSVQLITAWVLQTIFSGLYLFLILHLIFSKRVTEFFKPNLVDGATDVALPPPPPSFEE